MGLVEVERWAKVGEFNPISPLQVKAYCKEKKYKIPLSRKERKETTNDEALSGMISSHPEDRVLPLILEARHLLKATSYLTDKYLGGDGRMHPLYTFLPKTGRLSSKAPNIMNLPQGRKGEVLRRAAEAIRGTIIPTPGYVLGEFDWKAIEALLVGWFAEDPDYMRVARLGVHAFVACHGLNIKVDLSRSDGELLKLFEEVKENHPLEYATFKKGNHAYNYLQGERNMAKDLGLSLEETRKIRSIIDAAAPKVAAFKRNTLIRAHEDGFLTNPFGYSLAFSEVLSVRDGKTFLGKNAPEAVAFLPQSTGAGMLREVLLTLGNHPDEGEKFRLLIPTHDSITFEVRIDCVEEVMGLVQKEMERPWEELGGLRVEVDGAIGWTLEKKKLLPWRGKVPEGLLKTS